MPKKTDPRLTQEEQSKRFLEAARDIEADGGLSREEATERFEKLVRGRRQNSTKRVES